VSLAISPCHFGIAEISFFDHDYKFTTKVISHGKLFNIPRFDNIECDIDKKWLEHRLKERDPNKLGTRNFRIKTSIQPPNFQIRKVMTNHKKRNGAYRHKTTNKNQVEGL